MRLDRRDLLKASAALGGALTLKSAGLLPTAGAATGAVPVIWLQGQSCTGCAVSFLNSVFYATADDLLLNQLDVKFQSNVMAAAGDLAVDAAYAAQLAGGYVLILEGAIPFGDNGQFCHIWENTSMVDAVRQFAPGAIAIIALGTCASFGGIYAGAPNPTQTRGVSAALTALAINKPVINIPGCPAHPDWLVGVVASLLNGQMPALDSSRRPVTYYGDTVHSDCPNLSNYNSNYAGEIGHAGTRACLSCHSASDSDVPNPRTLGLAGCLYALNCKGRLTYADCGVRKWNSGAANQYGQEWCVGAGSPCIGCTQPNFPDGMSPFFVGGTGGTGQTADTITVVRAEYHTATRRLLVEATSSRQPQVTLTVTGQAQMTWVASQNLYRLERTNVAQPSGNITVTSNLNGTASRPLTLINTGTDTVTLTRAEYRTDTRQLTVEATSSGQPNATLTVTGYGQMTWVSAENRYRLQQTNVNQPSGTITVTSSQGGSANGAVTIIGTTNDTVTVTLAEYRTATQELLVRATSSGQPNAALTVTGFGTMTWNSTANYYQLQRTGIAQPSGSITVTSSLGGTATRSITVVGTTNDTVTITLAEYRTATQELLVRATSTGQPNATLTVTGFGTMTWSSTANYYQLQRTGIAQPSGSITVTSSLGGTATRSLTVISSTTDTVTVTLAEYRTSTRELLVRATSSRQPTPTLRVTGYGQMYWTSGGYYQMRKQNVSQPSTVTVTSSFGGSGSRTVTVIGTTTTVDTVRITRAEYDYDDRELVVEATSSRQPSPTLTVTNQGTMTWSSDRNCYRLRRTGVSRPSSVTVRSSLGGSATRSVTLDD